MKKKIICGMLCFSLLLTACSKEKVHMEQPADKNAKVSKNEVVWTIEESEKIPEENVEKLNKLLYEKGYDVAVKFQYIKNDVLEDSPESYHAELEEVIEKKETDIVFCGWEYESWPGEMQEFFRKDYFYSLNDWLGSEEGRQVYDLYDKEIWEASKIDGEIVTLPNEKASYQPGVAVCFQNDFISKDKAEAWGGTWDELLELLNHVEKPKTGLMIAGVPGLEGFQGTAQDKCYQVKDNLVYDVENGKITQPFETKGFYEYFSFLHNCFEKGYLSDVSLGEDNYTQEELVQCERGNYVIALNENPGGENTTCRFRSFSVGNDLGTRTAVCKESDRIKEALVLLKALRIDSELANTLIWQTADKDKLLDKDGFVSGGEQPAGGWCLGLEDKIYQEQGRPSADMRGYKQDLLQSKYRVPSHIAGFYPDYTEVKEELQEYEKYWNQYKDCWKEADFKKVYREASKVMAKKSERLLTVLNREMQEWKMK